MKKESTLRKSETNFERLHSMTDEDIDFTDLPETTPEMWAKGVLRRSINSQEILPIDRDIVEFFKSQGRGYQEKINQLLRAYMEAHQPK